MRISDGKIAEILSDPDGWLLFTIDCAKDLYNARAEIAQLKKDNAELIKCIEDIKK